MTVIRSIISISRAVLILVAATGLGGCNSEPNFPFEGTWIGHRQVAVTPGTPKDVATSLGVVKVMIKPNDRFDIFYNGVPASGNVAIEGKKATLTVTDLFGQGKNDPTPHSPPFILIGRPDGSIVFHDQLLTQESTTLKRTATEDDARP